MDTGTQICEPELNEIMLHTITNRRVEKDFQVFLETISFKKASNMFDHIEVEEPAYGSVVEPFIKKIVGKTPTVLVSVVK